MDGGKGYGWGCGDGWSRGWQTWMMSKSWYILWNRTQRNKGWKIQSLKQCLAFNKKLLIFEKKKKKHLHCELSVIYTKKHLFWYFMNVSTLNVNCQISPIFSKCIKDFNFWDSWFRKKWLNILLIFNLYVYKSTEKQIIDIYTLITEIQKAKKIEPGVSLSCSNKNIAFIKKRHITNNKLWMTCWINFWYRPKF